MPERPGPDECANCGAAIPRGAKACPACGADERTGWREQDACDDLDLPEEAWTDGDRPPNRAMARSRSHRRGVNGVPWYWWCVGIALIAVLALGALALL